MTELEILKDAQRHAKHAYAARSLVLCLGFVWGILVLAREFTASAYVFVVIPLAAMAAAVFAQWEAKAWSDAYYLLAAKDNDDADQ